MLRRERAVPVTCERCRLAGAGADHRLQQWERAHERRGAQVACRIPGGRSLCDHHDPLEVVLDRLTSGDTLDREVRYTINRMALFRETDGEDHETSMFDFKRSLAAYAARKAAEEQEFNEKVTVMKKAIEKQLEGETDPGVLAIASKSGLPAHILSTIERAAYQAAR